MCYYSTDNIVLSHKKQGGTNYGKVPWNRPHWPNL